MEIQDLLQWLENTNLRLSSSKTLWGMPDSASERLNAHLVKWTTPLTFNEEIDKKLNFCNLLKLSVFFSPTTGVVQWDGVEAPRLHRCEECHPQDAGEQQRGPWIEHWAQLVYPWAEMGNCLQQNPGAEGYFTFHIIVSSWWFLSFAHDYIWVVFFPQAKLAEGLSLAKEFHSNVQELLFKMSKCADSIGLLPAPSFVLDTVCTQLQDHRVGFFIPAVHFLSFCSTSTNIPFIHDMPVYL